jgi:hypothetical protein
VIVPSAISTILLKDRHIVLLPAPVLPTTPIFSPGFTSKVKFFSTTSVVGRYLRFTLSKYIDPYSGQSYLSSKKFLLSSTASVFS